MTQVSLTCRPPRGCGGVGVGVGAGLLCIEVSRQANVPIDNLIRPVSLEEGFCMWRKGLQLTAS